MAHPIVRWKLTLSIIGLATLVIVIYELVERVEFMLAGGNFLEGWTGGFLFRVAAWGAAAVVAAICGYWYAGDAQRKYRCAAERLKQICEEEVVPVADSFAPVSLSLAADHLNALMELVESYAVRHRRLVAELRKANDYLYSIIKESPAAIYILDLEGRVMQVNSAFESLYGYTGDEVRDSISLIVPERLAGETDRLIERIQAGYAVNGYETWRRTSEGKEVQVSLTISPIRGESGRLEALAIISRNITERKETEERMRRSEKLSVVGQLAAGVAHEIRNPLTTLRGFVQLFRQRNIGKEVHLELMLEELDRINLIVSEFIVLAKPHLNQYMIKDIGALLKDMVRIMEPQANLSNIMLESRIDPVLPKIRCEENQLKQVFLNIIKNGMEAMPGGGILTLEARSVEPDRVLIRIRDRGVGIPEELLTRLGEPFLTNKEHGTGLGIMISQQILANHQGQMMIRSEMGKGTCVDILLPVDFESWLEAAPASQQEGKLA